MGGMSDICIRCKINVHAKLSTQFKRSSSPMWWRLYVRRWGSLVGGGGEYGGDDDEYDDGGRGWVICQGICGGAMLEVTTPIICLGLEAII